MDHYEANNEANRLMKALPRWEHGEMILAFQKYIEQLAKDIDRLSFTVRKLRDELAIYRFPEELTVIPFVSLLNSEGYKQWIEKWDQETDRLIRGESVK